MRHTGIGLRRSEPPIVRSHDQRVPPALTAFAPGNTARGARRVGTPETLAAKPGRRRGMG